MAHSEDCILCCRLVYHIPIPNSRDLITRHVLSRHTMTYCMNRSPLLGCEASWACHLNKEIATTVRINTTLLRWNAGSDICIDGRLLDKGRHAKMRCDTQACTYRNTPGTYGSKKDSKQISTFHPTKSHTSVL